VGGASGAGSASSTGGAVDRGEAGGEHGESGAGGTSGAAGGAAARAGSAGDARMSDGASGSSALALGPSFYVGADVTDQETQPTATRASLLTLLKAHGFNYVRLRTFVDPKAADGYDQTDGYDDLSHTVAFGKQIKDAGMGLLVDFHYSDNWADPGMQCVPLAWQAQATIGALAAAVHAYTLDAITQLIAGGARPDMVQLGNETTPGLLIHRCDSSGQPLAGVAGYNPINGALYFYSKTDQGAPPTGAPAIGGWTNLGLLLNAAAKGVREADLGILIALHIDRGNDLASSRSFIQNALTQGVPFDAFGESCYTGTQGQPPDWQATFTALASAFPQLKFFIAEYGAAQRAANDVVFDLPDDRGIGSFNWQPTSQGSWNTGHDLIRRSGTSYNAQPDLALYDQMKLDYASRL
jgi:arabinogalactan endo-1,4-beta-galactosidase